MAGEAEIERMVVRLLGDASQYEQSLKRSAKATQTFSQRAVRQLNKVSQTMKSMGRNLSFRLTAPLTLLGVAAIKVGADFQKGFTGVKKTVNATEGEFATLRQDFKDMALEIPLAVEELLKLGESGGQLGIATKNILGFSRVMAALGVSTNLASEEAAVAFAQIANITKLSQTQFENLGSTLVALGNDTATNEAKIVNMSMRIAGAGTQAGLATDEIFAMAASLSSVGQSAEAGGTSFSKFLLKLLIATKTGGKDLEEFAKISGVSVEQFKKNFSVDASGAVIDLLKGLKNLGSEKILAIKEDLGITDQRSISMLLAASGGVEKFAKNLNLAKKSFEENTALAEEAAKAYKTFWSQVTLLKNQLKDVLEKVFVQMEPALLGIIDRVKSLVDWFGNLSPKTLKLLLVFSILAATLGPIALMLGSVAGSIGFMVVGITAAIPAVLGLGAAFTAMGISATAAWAAATLGISLLVLAVVAAGVAIFRMLGENEKAKDLKKVGEQQKAIMDKVKAETDAMMTKLDPIKRKVDLDVKATKPVDVEVRFNVIDAAAVGSADARARILEYQALRGPSSLGTPGISTSNGLQTPGSVQAKSIDSPEAVTILKEMLVLQKQELGKPDLEEVLSSQGGRLR